MPEFQIRDQIGKLVYTVEGKFPNYRILEYLVMEAPGDHGYTPGGSKCWLIGKLIRQIGEKPGSPINRRPVYCDIPWKRIAYQDSMESFHDTPEGAFTAFLRRVTLAKHRLEMTMDAETNLNNSSMV